MLQSLDRTLIPAAKNRELKAQLEKVRGKVKAHLERAQKLQAALGR